MSERLNGGEGMRMTHGINFYWDFDKRFCGPLSRSVRTHFRRLGSKRRRQWGRREAEAELEPTRCGTG